jgi:RNA polymerase sigma-70 factor (ECF subfamily)
MPEARPSDMELVRSARNGNVDAFGVLVTRHQDYIHNAVFHLVGNRQDAEELSQEVFVRAFSSLDGFRGKARFTTWVYGIMLNTVRSHWRRAGRHTVLSLDASDEEDAHGNPGPVSPADTPQEASLRLEDIDTVRRAIAHLDEDLREITVLRDIQGLTYDELAATLGVPQGTVKSRLHRARHQLKAKLLPYYGDRQ